MQVQKESKRLTAKESEVDVMANTDDEMAANYSFTIPAIHAALIIFEERFNYGVIILKMKPDIAHDISNKLTNGEQRLNENEELVRNDQMILRISHSK